MLETLFAPIEPYATGWLDVPQGHQLWYEQCGNPRGIPVVFLHGGPGSSINPNHRRFFDPAVYRVVLYDQRGCGQSKPRGETRNNTTALLVDDLERLRAHLEITGWVLFGGSWGSTLALAYAQSHPEVVNGCVLRGLFLGSDREVEWFVTGLRRFLPEAWDAFVDGAPEQSADGLVRYFGALLEGPGSAAVDAAVRWNNWESAVLAVGETPSTSSVLDQAVTLDRVRIQLHYLVHRCFLAPDQLIDGIGRLRGVPAILVQGRRDLACPPVTAYRVAKAWPGALLRVVEGAGHSAMHPLLSQALIQALQELRPQLRFA